jgi:hypothetical protein
MALSETDGRVISTIRTDLLRDAHALSSIYENTDALADEPRDRNGYTRLEQAISMMQEAAALLTRVVGRPSG